MKLYKYKSLKEDGFRHFVDIILNERIYASSFQILRNGNDEKEGAYYHSISDEKIQKIFAKEVLDQKSRFNICCFSTDSESDKMWKEYADDYKGVIVVLEIDEKKCFPIQYVDDFPNIPYSEELNHKELAKKILTHKRKDFCYENEMRVFTTVSNYVGIKVKEIIVGKDMPNEEYEFVKKLVSKINLSINVRKQER